MARLGSRTGRTAAHSTANRPYSAKGIDKSENLCKGSLYQYFDDKRDLYLVDLAASEKKRFLIRHPPPDPAMGLFDYLRWMVRVGVAFELSQAKLAQVAYRALFGEYGRHLVERLRLSAGDLGTGKLTYEDLQLDGFEQHLISFLERGLRPGSRGVEREGRAPR